MRRGTGAPFALCLALAACGYQPLYASGDHARLHVRLARSFIADSVAADEVVSGVRDALARDGALAAGDGYPRVEVEVLRVDVAGEGIAEAPNGAPHARALEVAVTARAWVTSGSGAPMQEDTGDLRVTTVAAEEASALGEAVHHPEAVRAASRRAGRRLGERILGHPGPVDDAF